MAGTPRAPTIDDYKAEAVNTLAAMTPAERARQQFVNTITNFGNSATLGLLGRAGDLVRGVPQGTTGDQVRAQLDATGSTGAVSSGLGYLAPAGAVKDGIAAIGGVRSIAPALARAFAPAEVIGTRAAALGAKASLPVGRTIAGFALPAAVAGAIEGHAEANANAAPVLPPAIATPASNPVSTALASGRAAGTDPQSLLANEITNILGRPHSIADLQTVGSLVPAAVKPTGTMRDSIFGHAYENSKAIADAQVASLQAQAQAGTITPAERDAAITKTLQQHTNFTGALVGFDPSKLSIANAEDAAQ